MTTSYPMLCITKIDTVHQPSKVRGHPHTTQSEDPNVHAKFELDRPHHSLSLIAHQPSPKVVMLL